MRTPGETLAYTDPTYGYSFDYPAAWRLSTEDAGGNNIILYSYEPVVGDGRPVPKDKLKVFFWVAEGVNKPAEEWLEEGANSPGQISPRVVVAQTGVTVDGKQGLTQITDEGEGIRHASYYIPIGAGRIFVVNAGRDDSELWPEFEVVLASIRLPP
jgi:hypothetical protein